jgi:Cof subfamily protein (haloacid dehalogenase superfamily)
VVSDVDGTLVTAEKIVTPATRAAVDALRNAGIRFTITSSRPPRGVKYLIEALALTDPIAAINGGVIITPDFKVLHESLLSQAVAAQTLEIIAGFNIDAWVFCGGSWYVKDRHGPHVDRETHTVGFEPLVVSSYENKLNGVQKIVAVTDDFPLIQKCEEAIHAQLGERVAASRSQKYYLDVTHPDANKGNGIAQLSRLLKIPAARIATIGDGANDVLMFRVTGLSIAMGNGAPEVQQAANAVTASNADDGFAKAMEKFILTPRGVHS